VYDGCVTDDILCVGVSSGGDCEVQEGVRGEASGCGVLEEWEEELDLG
jgi:hypothetical protein